VARVRGRLPASVDEPVIAKVEADATSTIWLSYTSETMSTLELTDIVNRSSSRDCRPSPAWPTCRWAVIASLRCASGSTPTSWRPTA
jgi:hypothetical protein